MRSRRKFHPPVRRDRRYVVLPIPRSIPKPVLRWGLILGLIGTTNFFTHRLSLAEGTSSNISFLPTSLGTSEPLYLMDKATPLLQDPPAFRQRVREVADQLEIPVEWLMAVMYAESRFDPSVVNRRGSTATGLIQFMPGTAAELGVTTSMLGKMSATEQLTYVYAYLDQVRERYGPYQSLTDLYLGILYPKARNQDYCFTLYAKPSVAYNRNSGLDRDKDGRVSVSDVDRYLREKYPTAFVITLNGEENI